MNKKNNLPTMVSDFKLMQLERMAKAVAHDFTNFVSPLLLKFGVLDDAHIMKYLNSATMEAVYNDVLKENPEKLKYLEQVFLFEGEDVWAPLRAINSPVKSPNEDGFIFAPMPRSNDSLYKTAVRSLIVQNCHITVDEKTIERNCIIQPTGQQQELYELVTNFCDALKEKGFHKKLVNLLFMESKSGIKPNLVGIMNAPYLRILK